MEIMQKIERIKAKHLKEIEEAAKKSDTATIIARTKDIVEIEKRYSEFENWIIALEKNKVSSTIVTEATFNLELRPSFKAQGKKRRMEFMQVILDKGIKIIHLRGVKYKIGSKLICIASASIGKIPDRWFMGIPPDNYSAIVLICEEVGGHYTRFILDRKLYLMIAEHQNTSGDGQLKFNIHKNGSSYFLKLNGLERIKLDSFIDSFELLKNL